MSERNRKIAEYLKAIALLIESDSVPQTGEQPLVIPEGWRELSPDEVPRLGDMAEQLGAWRARKSVGSKAYELYEVRHIRKIEPANTSETTNSSTAKPGYFDDVEGVWVDDEPDPFDGRKIETKPTEWIPKVGDRVRVLTFGRIASGYEFVVTESVDGKYTVEHLNLMSKNLEAKDIQLIEAAEWVPKTGDWVKVNKHVGNPGRRKYWNEQMDLYNHKIGCVSAVNVDRGFATIAGFTREGYYHWQFDFDWLEPAQAPADHIADVNKMVNTPAIPDSSMPDPGEGYRLLSKDPPEDLQPGDDFNNRGKWLRSTRADDGITKQDKCYYRRKIEQLPTEWIPKVGDKVRVSTPGRAVSGVECVVEGKYSDGYVARSVCGVFRSTGIEAKDLELIEPAKASADHIPDATKMVNPSETPNSSTAKPGYFDDVEGVWVDEPNPFEGRKIEQPAEAPEPQYREPTYADLANGPIEVEVNDDERDECAWVKRMLYAVLPAHVRIRFVCNWPRETGSIHRWNYARIKVS